MVPTANDIKAPIMGLPVIFPIRALNAAWIGSKAPAITAISKKNILFIAIF